MLALVGGVGLEPTMFLRTRFTVGGPRRWATHPYIGRRVGTWTPIWGFGDPCTNHLYDSPKIGRGGRIWTYEYMSQSHGP